ncbi:MAG: CoA transferase [Phenylobacterium sp.]|uniref:CaiB/BaiF CoA transferase family protein n=1 Tax=Phenylobacterium sp. TaxID=1871053 RepID=UPI001A2A5DC0|nr:CaiB/BaiF CoA-transferase family protein [Phenylobacterium sp.]MBJ7412057.1 CoA transferase [Phenylobacterium sp.]
MPASLDGVLVVALEQAVAAPLCTAKLAEAGARVIKVERTEGDFARSYDHVVHGESAYFVWLNRGKESIALDVKNDEDAQLLSRMIAAADVFVQNLAPGAAARAGFGSDDLRARHPRLITCDISGYGEDGPWTEMKAYDFLVQCEAGLAAITGTVEGPSRVGVSVADICCGMNAHAAILQALYERQRTGSGSGVSVSLFDGLTEWMTVPLLHHDYGGRAPGRSGMHHPSIAPYGAYSAGDGKEVVLAVQNEREWLAFCDNVLAKADLAKDPRFATNSARCANRTALDSEIAAVLNCLTAEELIARFKKGNIAFGSVNGVAELSRHPQLRRTEALSPSGPVALPASAARWKGDPVPPAATSPALNAHGDALRLEFSQ